MKENTQNFKNHSLLNALMHLVLRARNPTYIFFFLALLSTAANCTDTGLGRSTPQIHNYPLW